MNEPHQILCEIIPILRLYVSYNNIQSLIQTNKSIQQRTLQILDDDLYKSYHTMMTSWCENPEYTSNVVYHPFGAIGYVRKICSWCHEQTPCKCNLGRPYLGMLVRRQKDQYGNMVEYKSLLIHTCAKELIKWHIQGLKLAKQKFVTINTNFHFPSQYLESRHSSSCNYISKPYFNVKGDVCVLEGLKGLDEYPDMYECALSGTNQCVRREVYFTFANKQYPFGRLNITPLLFDVLIEKIVNNQCDVKRTLDETIFASHDFFKQHIPEESLMPVLATIFENEERIDTNNIDDTLKAVLCFKRTGNETLAYQYLNFCDKDNSIWTYKSDNFFVTYFGKICTMNESTNDIRLYKKRYKKILNRLTDVSSIEHLKEQAQQKKIITGVDDTFFVIKKKYLDYSITGCHPPTWNNPCRKVKVFNCTNFNFYELTIKDIHTMKFIIQNSDSSGLPPHAYTMAHEYLKINNKQNYIDQLQEDSLAILLKSLHVAQHSDTPYIKKNLLGRFCPCAPDIPYHPDLAIDDTLSYEQLSDLYIRSNLEKIIDTTIHTSSFDENDYTEEELKITTFSSLSKPKTCMQLVTYLDKAKEWHNPSAKLRRAYPNYQKEQWYQLLTQPK